MLENKSKPIKSRLSLPCWLEEQISSGRYKGLRWVDRSKREFTVPWKHASRQGWLEDDAALFKAWAVYTRRYREERGDLPDPKKWKANFRCAVNACPDIFAVKSYSGSKRGQNACRVFKFERNRKSKKYVTPRNPGVRLIQGPRNTTSPSSQSRPTFKRQISIRSSKRLRIKNEEISDCEMSLLPQVRIKDEKVEDMKASCKELAKFIKQEDSVKVSENRKISSTHLESNGEVKFKDIKLEHIDWPPQITVKEMLQLPKPGKNAVDGFDYFEQLHQQEFDQRTFFNSISSTNSNDNTHNSNSINNNENSTNEMFAFLVEYMHDMVKEEPNELQQIDDLYTSGSEDESVIGPGRLGSVSSSLSNEELEKMLSFPDNSKYEHEDLNYQQAATNNTIDRFNFISTYTDPFLGSDFRDSDIQEITASLKSELNVISY